MSYAPVPSSSSPPSSPHPNRSQPSSSRTSFASLRRPSLSSLRFNSRSHSHTRAMPDPDEMDAAFDGPEDESGPLLPSSAEIARSGAAGMPGTYDDAATPGYDFEADYTRPPPSPPPFQPYSSNHPAPGNTNGIIPSSQPARPAPARHFLGGILPSAILPRQASPRMIGGGQEGVFSNLSARPQAGETDQAPDGAEYVSEIEQKEGPPSYQMALRDAVPPYWDTTVVLPSSSSPFGPLSSSMSGDEILIDGMPVGNFFGFLWNLVVSFSFQFIGFLLTYVLHTTHAAKYGSRIGLGITFIQFGLNLRNKAEKLLDSGEFPADPSDPTPTLPDGTHETSDEVAADNALKALWGPGSIWPQNIKDPLLPPDAPPVTLHNVHEAEMFAQAHNTTLSDMLGLPTALDVGKANEWFSFMLMCIGWFLVLTSVGGWWRVKRFERGLKRAQREGEEARAAALRGAGAGEGDESEGQREGAAGEDEGEGANGGPGRRGAGPRELAYYTQPIAGLADGLRNIQQGFFGMRGRPISAGLGGGGGSPADGEGGIRRAVGMRDLLARMRERGGGGRRGGGHAPLPGEGGGEEEDLELYAMPMALGSPMAGDGGSEYPGLGGRGRRGLWGV